MYLLEGFSDKDWEWLQKNITNKSVQQQKRVVYCFEEENDVNRSFQENYNIGTQLGAIYSFVKASAKYYSTTPERGTEMVGVNGYLGGIGVEVEDGQLKGAALGYGFGFESSNNEKEMREKYGK